LPNSQTKYLILVPDGSADIPVPELGWITPLEAARTPWMDKMASAGRIGVVQTVPEGMSPGSDVAILSVLGYSPLDVYTGRAPLEAASMAVLLESEDLAFRLNLVTLNRDYTIMVDHSADHISTAEAHEILASISPMVASTGLSLIPGVSYRSLLVWRDGPEGLVTYAPHDFPGGMVADKLPSGTGSETLLRIIFSSWKILRDHTVNKIRVEKGLCPANSVWPWGQGKPPRMESLEDRFGISGSVVAAVDLVRGIGKYAGLDLIDVPGATGYLDTNYRGKAEAALTSLRDKDFVFLHVEAPDEAGHSGRVDLKIRAIEDFDEKVVAPVLAGLTEFPAWRILLMPDHPTPIATRVHSSEPVPFVLLDSEQWHRSHSEATRQFTERAAQEFGPVIDDGTRMIEMLLQRNHAENRVSSTFLSKGEEKRRRRAG
jgi:2,3-bisphosphoglycerate-independent phosphoglycerate mutase